MSRTATTRRAIWIGLLVIALLTAGESSAWGSGASRLVRYHDYRLSVPSSWPVFDLARHPATCVRFNRHAVYLGNARNRQRCPAHAVGRTEAILVSPLRAGVARAGSAPGAAVRGVATAGSGASYVVPTAGLVVTATWSRDRALVTRILSRRLATAHPPLPSPSARLSRQTAMRAAGAGGRALRAEAAYGGLGFDACSTPSAAAMSAWSVSPFRAVGVYIGGVNSACSQPNLTPAWVSGEVAAGWHLIPTYVGLQGVGSCSGSCATISSSQATAQGTLAAADAVTQAQALGLGAGNPIYDDMEQYAQSPTNTEAVLAFLSAWTTQLHAHGYLSGVYSSASSAITDLVNVAGTGYPEPDDIWVADWNGAQTTADGYVPAADWSGQTRLHQYRGGHDDDYGGVTLNIDSDYLDGATADTGAAAPPPAASPAIPDGTFVEVAGSSAVYEIAGGAPMLASSWTPFGGPQPVDVISPQRFAALAPYPASGTFLTTTGGASYRVAGGTPFEVSNWALFGGPPPAVAAVTVDQWDLSNIANPLAHLLVVPANGTLVQGLPSGSYWAFSGGYRMPVGASPGAVAVDDLGLAQFAVAPPSGGVGPASPQPHRAAVTCAVPRLKHMSLRRARSALHQAHCSVGLVRRPRHWGRHHLLRVFGQSAPPKTRHPVNFKVNLRLL